jgi:hypothetical protein
MAAALAATMLVGCGGGGGGPSGSDPSATVKDFFATVTAGDYAKLPDYACAAKKDQFKFDPSQLLGGGSGGALGLTADDIKSIFKISVTDLVVKEKSKEATKAIVTVSGKMGFTIDKEKFKAVLKTALEKAGQKADDATLTMTMGMLDSLAGETTDLSTDAEMVNEGGKWLICDSSVMGGS